MHQLIKQLYDLLREERAQYDALADLLRKECEALQQVRTNALQEIVAHRDMTRLRIKRCEQQRMELICALAVKLDCPPVNFRISLLLPYVPAKGRDLLEQLRRELKTAIDEVRRETANVERAASSMLGIFQETMEYIVSHSGARQSVSYGEKMRPRAGRMSVQSVVLSHQA